MLLYKYKETAFFYRFFHCSLIFFFFILSKLTFLCQHCISRRRKRRKRRYKLGCGNCLLAYYLTVYIEVFLLVSCLHILFGGQESFFFFFCKCYKCYSNSSSIIHKRVADLERRKAKQSALEYELREDIDSSME